MAPVIHGHARRHNWSREYKAYFSMRNRCLNPNQKRYRDYGARGIHVCDRWLRGDGIRSGFECFLEDVGAHPGEGYSLDRIKNERGYEPGNTRWATRSEQARNTRATRYVEIEGERLAFAEAVERFGCVSAQTAAMRVHRGWPDVKAITTPIATRAERGLVLLG